MTIQQHASFDSSAAELNATSKLVKAWESKNAKNAARAGGVSLMALSLAACGGSDDTPITQAALDAQTAAATAAAAAQAAAEAESTAAAAAQAAAEADAATAAEAQAAAEAAQAASDAAAATAAAEAAAAAEAQAAAEAAQAEAEAALAAVNAPKTLEFTNSTTADNLIGGVGSDVITAAAGTMAATDRIADASTTDSDTLTITHSTAPGAFTSSNIETIDVTMNNLGALAVDAQNFSGVNSLSVTRGDVEIGGVTLSGDKTVVVNNVNGADVASITVGAGTTSVDINAEAALATTGQSGITVNADAATTTVAVNLGPATINADNAVTSVSIDGAIYTTAAELAKASVINAASAATVATDSGLTGSVEINAAAATAITVSNAGGGATVNGSTTSTADSTITLVNVDASGATVTAGTGSSVASAKQMNVVIDGTTASTDAATINAAGVVALDADATSAETVDILTLGSTGGAVTYNIATPAGGTDNDINTINGTSDVTVAGNASVFSGATIDGVATIDLNAGTTGTAVDADSWSNVGKIDVGYDVGNAVSYLNGQTYELTLDQTGLDLDLYATGTAQTVSIVAGDDNGTDTTVGTIEVGALTVDNTDDTVAGTITIEASIANFTATSMDFGAKQNLVITGDEDVNLGQTTGGATTSINAAASSGIITLETTTLAPTVTTGSGADVITVNGADVHTVSTNDGNDQIVISSTSATSTFDGGAGNDQFTLTDAAAYVVIGGDGNDTFTTGSVIDAVIVGGDGTDTITLDATRDLSAKTNFAMSSIEALNLTAGNFTIDSTQFAGDNTFAITADGDTFRVDVDATTGGTIDATGVTVASGSTAVLTYAGNTGVDNITGGASAETILQSVGADSYDGGTGTDSITLVNTATDVDGTLTGDSSTGVIINLGSTAIDEATVLSNVTRHFGEGTTSVGSGKASFLFTAASASNAGQVNADVLQSVQSIENITGGTGNDYIVGSAGANTINGKDGADYLSGGDGNDTFVISALADLTDGANAVEDIINGGNGTDTIAFDGSVTLAAADDFTDKVSNIDSLSANGAQTGAISLTTHATFVSDTGITTIDLSADTSATGANVIDISNQTTTTAMTLRGSAGSDTITGDAGSIDTHNVIGDIGGLTLPTIDQVIGFVSGTDKVKVGIAGDATALTGNYVEVADADYTLFSAILTAANSALATLAGTSSATTLIAVASDATDADAGEVSLGAHVFIDTDGDGDADEAFVLDGLAAATIAHTDFIA